MSVSNICNEKLESILHLIGKRDNTADKRVVTNKLRMPEIQEAPTSMVQGGEGTKRRVVKPTYYV